ncbi:hypothetical protein KQI65_03690 [bacterium]|nr:hypothetical protein [bacterium]
MTSHPAILSLILGTVLLCSTLQAQEVERVRNDGMGYHVLDAEGVSLFILDGYAPVSGEEIRIPSRIVRLRMPQGDLAEYVIEDVALSAPIAASPFYYVEGSWSPDSAVVMNYRPFNGVINSRPATDVRILRQEFHQAGNEVEAVIELPLLTWNPATGETRMVEEYTLRRVRRDGLAASIAADGKPPYMSMPFTTRSNNVDTSHTWIDYSLPMLKFYISQDGIFHLTADWIRASGINPADVNPATVQLIRKGRPVAMYARGMEDGVFDDGDEFIFHGTKNYDERGYKFIPEDWLEPYPQYMSIYTDSTAYWLSFSVSDPLRAEIDGGMLPLPLDTLDWAMEKVHLEQEYQLQSVSADVIRIQDPHWSLYDTWFWTWTGRGGSVTVQAAADHIKPGQNARAWGKLMHEYGTPSISMNHVAILQVNNVGTLDSQNVDYGEQMLLSGSLPSDSLREGSNILFIDNLNIVDPQSDLKFDWAELEYPRFLEISQGWRVFQVDSTMPTGVQLIRLQALSANDPVVLRVTNDGRSRVLPVAGFTYDSSYTVYIADTVIAGATYFVALDTSIRLPQPGTLHDFKPLSAVEDAASYVVITAPEFVSVCGQYTDFITERYGVDTRIVNIDDIYDEYSYGMFQPEAIKLFLFDAYHEWVQDSLKYVFLIGDANYNYKAAGATFGRNYVPSYGYPVSDVWFVAFDSLQVYPKISIGRLPVSTPGQITDYLEKHDNYLDLGFDLWNKTSLHFSGGFRQIEYAFYSGVNWSIINESVVPPDYAGNYTHFYKTADPPSDFGPYERQFLNDRIDDGGIFISYIGHSGTRIWDNTITRPSQLASLSGRPSLLTDFGCSTGKFAEPNYLSFSEVFVSTGEDNNAIAYIGNAAAGFENTLTTMPLIFYRYLLQDNVLRIGDTHRLSKNEMSDIFGVQLTSQIAIQTNTLIGDPIISLPIPQKTNPIVKSTWIRTVDPIITDRMDTLRFRVAVGNFGRKLDDSLDIRVEALNGGGTWFSQDQMIPFPSVFDTLQLSVPSPQAAGKNSLRVTLDIDNRIEEISESDNVAEYEYDILSTYLNVVDERLATERRGNENIQILNPLNDPGGVTAVEFEFDTDRKFSGALKANATYGRTVTKLESLPLQTGNKYYWRARLENSGEYVGPFIRWEGDLIADYIQSDSTTFIQDSRHLINLRSDRVELPPAERYLYLESGGWDAGISTIVTVDYGPNIFNGKRQGYAVAVLDSATLETKRWDVFYTWGNAADRDSLRKFIENVQYGEIAAVVVGDEGSRGAGVFANAMRSIGSALIDSVARYYRSSWAIIGRRGAAPGTVPEAFEPGGANAVTAIVDTTIAVVPDTGSIVSTVIGPATAWGDVYLERPPITEANILLSILGIDTLGNQNLLIAAGNVSSVDISSINATQYPYIRLRADLVPAVGQNPVLDSWAVEFTQRPELALNYQSIEVMADSVQQGETVEVAVGILNAGEGASASFPVQLDVVGDDNIPRQVAQFTVAGLASQSWFDSTVTINTDFLRGAQQLFVRVDRENAVAEQYEDNNTYISSFVVKPDTSRPQIEVTFDGYTPLNGDYIRYNPEIVVKLYSNNPAPIESVENLTVTIDGEEIAFDSLDYDFTPSTKSTPAILRFQLELADGIYYFGFNGVDAKSVPVYEDEVPELRLIVSTENRIAEMYNYPNPFTNETSFTFLLTGAEPPQELKVKVYTVAGRLIRVLDFPPTSMHIGYNALKWDGRDEDGDELANGVYFYKIVANFTEETFEEIGRMAVMR